MELSGKHRLVFDGISPEGVRDALQFAGNFFAGNRNGYGLEAGDILVIAGKGHERGQIIAGVTHPFDDAEVARAAIGKAGAS